MLLLAGTLDLRRKQFMSALSTSYFRYTVTTNVWYVHH